MDQGFAEFEAWAAKMEEEEAEKLRRLEKAIERETYTFYRSITAQRTRNEGRARALEAMRAAEGGDPEGPDPADGFADRQRRNLRQAGGRG